MPRDRVEIVRSVLDAFNRRDWDAAFRDQDPDIELMLPADGPGAARYTGRQEVQGYWQDLLSPFDEWTVELEESSEHGDQVAICARTRMRPKGSSAEMELRNGGLWTIRDGRVVSVQVFRSPEEALAAAGVTP